VAVGVSYLAGELPQGSWACGYAALAGLREGASAAEATLDLAEVDRAFGAIKAEAAAGSVERRASGACRRCSPGPPARSGSS
jgi:DNA ligase-1